MFLKVEVHIWDLDHTKRETEGINIIRKIASAKNISSLKHMRILDLPEICVISA